MPNKHDKPPSPLPSPHDQPPTLKTLLRKLHQGQLPLEELEDLQPLPPEVFAQFACDCAERALFAIRNTGLEPDPRSWEALTQRRKWLQHAIDDQQLLHAREAIWDASRNIARRVRSGQRTIRAASAYAHSAAYYAVSGRLTHSLLDTQQTFAILEWNLSRQGQQDPQPDTLSHKELLWQTHHLAYLIQRALQARRSLLTLLHNQHSRLEMTLDSQRQRWEHALF